MSAIELMGRTADGDSYTERWLISANVVLKNPKYDTTIPKSLDFNGTNAAWAAVIAAAPTTIIHQNVEYHREEQDITTADAVDDPEMEGDYICEVPYYRIDGAEISRRRAEKQSNAARNAKFSGGLALTVDIAGETINVKEVPSDQVVSTFGEFPDDLRGLIGATENEVAGVDVETGSFIFSATKWWPAGTLPAGYLDQLKNLQGRANSNKFTFFEVGELKFLGASIGEFALDGAVEITYNFHVRRNEVETIAGVEVEVKGWEYVDPYQKLVQGDNTMHYKIVGGQVVRPLEFVDMSQLQLENGDF